MHKISHASLKFPSPGAKQEVSVHKIQQLQ